MNNLLSYEQDHILPSNLFVRRLKNEKNSNGSGKQFCGKKW